MSDSVRSHRWQPTRLPRPWDSPDKNTGVGCHFLLHCMKVKSESEVPQLCPTLSDPMDCSLPGSSVHGLFQARVLEWGAIAFSIGNLGCRKEKKVWSVKKIRLWLCTKEIRQKGSHQWMSVILCQDWHVVCWQVFPLYYSVPVTTLWGWFYHPLPLYTDEEGKAQGKLAN